MTEPTPLRPGDDLERKQRADDALELLENKIFTAAVLALRKEWFQELMTAGLADRKIELVAMMKALEAIPNRLQIYVNDQKMHEARRK
jgi:hypothetical protein